MSVRDAVQLVVGVGHLAAVTAVVLDFRYSVIGIVDVFGFLRLSSSCFCEAFDPVLDVVANQSTVFEISVSVPLFALRRTVGKIVNVADGTAIAGIRYDCRTTLRVVFVSELRIGIVIVGDARYTVKLIVGIGYLAAVAVSPFCAL